MKLRVPLRYLAWTALIAISASTGRAAEPAPRLTIAWKDNFLTIRGEHIPGKEVRINYLEAYCRPGSTDRDWGETVIGHRTELVAADADRRKIQLKDTLRDGVIVEHTITASDDEVDFRLVAHNPTATASQAHWAQPCIRVDGFTGCDPKGRAVACIRRTFASASSSSMAARRGYQPSPGRRKPATRRGRSIARGNVDRNDVNPRPLSPRRASATGSWAAIRPTANKSSPSPGSRTRSCSKAWPRASTATSVSAASSRAKPSTSAEKSTSSTSDMAALVKRYERDFPEQVSKPKK